LCYVCYYCCLLQDTFLDAQHLIDSFPQYDVTFSSSSSGSSSISTGSGQYDVAALPPPPYKVTFPADQQQLKSAPGSTKRGADAKATTDVAAATADDSSSSSSGSGSRPVLLVEHYRPINMGPYPEDKPKGNEVRFTSVQVEAVAAGVQPGLTMVVGPPGTGKTDTAVQILQVS
jgi:intron-binding protein aquarius